MATKSYMSPTSMLMIHNVSSKASGDYRELRKRANTLETANKSIAAAYIHKTKGKITETNFLKYMDEETYFTAEQSKNLGLIDGIGFPKSERQALNEKLEALTKKQALDQQLEALIKKQI